MTATRPETDPPALDPIARLSALNEKLEPVQVTEEYLVLKPALFNLYVSDRAVFAVAAELVGKKLGIGRRDLEAALKPLLGEENGKSLKEAEELLDQMEQTSLLRLPQDFVDGTLWYGVIAGEDKLLLNSDRKLLRLDQVPEGLTVQDRGFDYCRLSKEAVLHFLSGATAAGAELLTDLRDFFTRFAVFKDKRVPLLLAAWTLGTYVYRVFRVFPYLAFRSPEKRCGKSRLLDLLSLLAFNASPRVVYPTEAQIFRAPSRNGGTLLLDEVEALKNADKENYAGLLAVLNSGCERGGIVTRLKKSADGGFPEETFETFAPRAIAGINRLAETLEDRSILITMQRKLAREKTDRFSPSRLGDKAQVLRDRCYLWALAHAAALAETYDHADRFFAPSLDSLDDRARDLWEPLVSIVALADVERDDGQKTLTTELTALALDLCQVRDGAAEDSSVVQVVKALQEIVARKQEEGLFQAGAEIALSPTELAKLLKETLKWGQLSTKELADYLNSLGFYSKHSRQEGRGRRYHLSEKALNELADRYVESVQEKGETPDEA